MAVDYLQEYLGIDPNDYSAMEQRIAGVSPVGQSILPQAPVLPRASIMDEDDFAAATAPLMDRVYGREQAAREKSESLSNELQALQEEMARTSEAEVEKRAALERQMQEIMQQRDVSVTSAENLAQELQGVQTNLAEITNARDIAMQDYQEALQQQDVIRQQAAENEAMRLEEQRNELLAERESIITTLEQDFGVQRSELESVIGGLEGKVSELESLRGGLEGQINDLSSQMQSLETEKQDAIAQQDVIRAEAAQAQQDALAQQGEQFASERSALEQQIADLTAQVGQQPPVDTPPPDDTPPADPPFIKPPTEDPITRPPIMCFVAGTKVDMADGTKKVIENIAVGDKVLALDNETDVVSYVHDIPEAERNLWTINDKITATDAHAFLTEDGWKSNNARLSNAVYNDYGIDVKTLKVGDKLITKDGLEKVTKLESEKDFVKVYNFTTSNTHTYLVDGVVSHNKMARPPIDRPPVDGPPRGGPFMGGRYEDVYDRDGRRIKSPDSRGPMEGRIGGPGGGMTDDRAISPFERPNFIGRTRDQIDEMLGKAREQAQGGLPDGYSYTPGPGSEGKAYTTVMPRPGFRYAFGPDGDRIQVPDNRNGGPPILPPTIPPKRDPRLDITRGKPIGGPIGGIEYGPVAPPPGVPDRMPIPLIPNIGGGTYKEFERPDGQVLSVGVRPLPTFSTNPNRKGQLVDRISSGLGTIGIASQPLIPSQQTTTRKQYMKPPSIGGVGGISGRRSMRPMMRAGGGAIGQAIADLQNRLR